MLSDVNITGEYYLNPIGYFFLRHTIEFMNMISLIFLILFLINFRVIIKTFSGVKLQTWIYLFLIFLLGSWLRNSEYRYGFGLDGFFSVDIARTLYEKNLYAKGCAIGNLDSCRLYHQHLFLAGYPYLIYLSFLFFGQHDIFAMYISGVLNSLTIILIFCITYLLFYNESKSVYSALVFALIPIDIFIAPTGATRPTSLFFISLTLLFYLIALRKYSTKIWSLVAITLSYSIYVRQENYILLVPMFLGLFLLDYFKEKSENLSTLLKKFSIPIAIFLFTQIMALHWILFGNVEWNPYGPMFSFKCLKILAPIVSKTFFTRTYSDFYSFSPLISFFFLSSLFFISKKEFRAQLIFLWVLFLSYFIVTTSYFQCHGFPERFCFEFVRYLQHFGIPYAILAGFTLSTVAEKIKFRNSVFVLICSLLLLTTPIQFKFSLFKDGRINEYPTGTFIKALNATPANSLVFISQSAIPTFDLVRTKERRWIDINLISADNYSIVWKEINESESKNREIYFIADYKFKHERDESYNFLYKNFKFKEIANFTSDNIITFVYKLTRI